MLDRVEIKRRAKRIARRGILPAALLAATVGGGYFMASTMSQLNQECISRGVVTENNARGPNFHSSELGCALFLGKDRNGDPIR